MNRCYRLVWNRARQVFVVASEVSRERGKAGRTVRARHLAWLAALPLSLSPILGMAAAPVIISDAMPMPRMALPTPPVATPIVSSTASPSGGQVTVGSGNISQSGLTTTINQHSQNLSLNWQSFNIGADSTVNFVQPDAQSIAVNRIADANGSVILGRLNANGQVFLINPNGVLFGQGAQVNVGGLVASTLNIDDGELAGGTRHFGGNDSGRGSVVNRGTINAAKGGYVALLGPQVTNQGTLNAPGGTVALAGGNAVTLSFDGNRLLSLQVDKSTLNALADNRQLIVADGGQVLMSAGAKDSLLASVVNNSGTIQAQTVENRAGKIVLLGGMAAGTTKVAGTLDASAPTDGHGGFIETSAAHVQVAEGTRITALAAGGNTGTWLIDPVDFTIAASGGDITGALLSSSLASADVTIQSTAGAGGTVGNINVNDRVSWSANRLTLNAQNNININADLNGSGTARLALEYGQATANGTGSGYTLRGGQVNLAAGNNFSTKLGSAGAVVQYRVITSLGAAGSVTGTDLQGVNGNLTGNYVLGANIDANATSGWNGGAGFDPIGGNGTSFDGLFDGLGHTISGLTINRPSENEIGLFAVANRADLRNVGLSGSNITGRTYVGALVGNSQSGTVTNAWSSGVVGGYSYVGGLIGLNNGGYVVQAHSAAQVTGTSQLIGGLIGQARFFGSVSDSYATGNVYASGATDVGGLIGQVRAVELSNSYATGAVTGGVQVGGLVGFLDGFNGGKITGSYASGAASGDYSVGGLVGTASGTVVNSYWVTDTTGQVTSAGGGIGLTAVQLIAALPTGFDAAIWGNGDNQTTPYLLNMAGNQVFNGNDLPTGTVTPTNRPNLYTAILDVNQLQVVNTSLNNRYALGNNIDASATINWNGGAGFAPLGNASDTPAFTGIFDGLAHTISGLTINRPDTDFVGLFGYTSNGTIRNLGLLGGSVIGKNNVGGLVGSNVGSTITNNYATGAVTGIDSVGGLVGFNSYGGVGSGTISNSYATGAVAGRNYVGGLIGTNYRAVIDSHASGSVIGGDQIGGLVGGFQSGSINNSHATGNVTATTGASGGLVGYASATISNSYASGSVSGIYQVGGILGAMNQGSIANSYSTSTVTGTGNVGGLVGNSTRGTITNTYSSGAVSGTTDVGGLLGSNDSATVVNGYWDLTTSGQVTSAGGTGLTSIEMQTPSKFAGFNFTATPGASGNNWVIVDGVGSLNNASGPVGATRPMLASEYSTTINNAHQLQLIAMAPAASYALGSDINAANTGLGNDVWGSTGFSSIGTFSGSFDGRNHVISGITINRPDLAYRGLFAYANSASSISNVGLVGGNVNGDSYAGSLVGRSEGSINSSYATGSVNGGGNYYVGGLVGWLMPGGTISNSYAAGMVASEHAGGLVGRNEGTISNSYASGAVTGTSSGGLTGLNDSGVVTDSFWDIGTTGRSTSTGGSGLTTAEMMKLASFSNWNIANTGGSGAVWRIYEGHTAPLLTGFMTNLAVTATNVTTTYNGTAFGGSTYYTFGALTPNQWLPSNSVDSSLLFGEVNTTSPAINAGSYLLNNGLYSGQRGYDIDFTAGTLTINQAALTISTSDVSKTYDGGLSASGSAVVTGGALFGSDAISGGSFAFLDKDAGTGKRVTVSGIIVNDGNGGNNYAVTYADNVTSIVTARGVTVAATGTDRVYDGGTADAVSLASSGILAGDTVSFSGIGAFGDKHVGTGKTVSVSGITASGTDAGNYSFNTTAATTADITALGITVEAAGIDRVYDGGTADAVSLVSSGILAGDTVSFSGTGAFADKHVGTAKAVSVSGITASGTDAGNYSFNTTAAATADITAASLTLSTSDVSKIYDGALSASGSALVSNGTLFGTDTLSGGSFAFTDKNAGTGKRVTVSGVTVNDGNSGNNYVVTYADNTAGTITALGVTVEATGTDRVYDGGTADAVNLTSSGILAGDMVSFSGTGTFADKNVGTGKTVNVSGIAASGSDAVNYSYNATANTTADISQLGITVDATGTNRVYDGTTADVVALASAGVLSGDVVSFTGTGSFADKHVGTAKNVSVSGITASGADAGNYSYNATANTTADISQLGITVDATGTNKVYDGTTADVVALASAGVLSGDVVSFTGTGSFADKHVGTAKNVSVSGITASGVDAGNYSYNATTGTTADITPATLTYRADGASFWTGQVPGDLGGAVTGLVGGDTLTDATAGVLTWSTPATSASPAGQYAIEGGGLSARNYVFAQAPGNALALRVSHSSAPLVVSNVVAGLQQDDETAPGGNSGTSTPDAPDVRIVGSGVRLP